MSRTGLIALALAAMTGLATAPGEARTLCTIAVDATDGRLLLEQGDCRTRVTPASTFKVPLAVIGFDNAILKDAHSPVWPYQASYVDWGGANWRQPTDPHRWLKYSVVWYSQLIAARLGEQKLSDAVRKLGFGNADFSGDPGRNNGLDRAWIASSLKVSPLEQVTFLRKLVTRQLPVSEYAMAETEKLVEISPARENWRLHGKTGTAYPRTRDAGFDETRGYGWYVGWARKDGLTFVFARLTQDEGKNRDEGKNAIPTGTRTRAQLLQDWPTLAAPFLP